MGTATNRRKYNVGLLKDPQTREEGYKLNLANTLHELLEQDEAEPDLNSLWQNSKEILTSNYQDVVSRKKTQQKDWIAAINKIRTRATKAQVDHTKANIKVQKSVQMDKRKYINSLTRSRTCSR